MVLERAKASEILELYILILYYSLMENKSNYNIIFLQKS